MVKIKPEKIVKPVKHDEKNGRTVFVGNLPAEIAPRTLRKHFMDCGDIESVRLRGLIPEKPKMPRRVAAIKKDKIHQTCKTIFGYVVFRSPESVERALELSSSCLEGRFISVQRVGQTTYDQKLSIFCGNLPIDVQENAIHEFFADCGKIKGVRVVRDSATGAGKGFAFVAFDSRDGVELALEKDASELSGRQVRIMRAGQRVAKKDLPPNTRNKLRRLEKKQKKKTSVKSSEEQVNVD